MNEAFIQYAQHDIDHQDRHQQQNRKILKGALELPYSALEAGADGSRHAQLADGVIHKLRGLAQGKPRAQVEGNGHRRQLAEMVDGKRPGLAPHANHRFERHQRIL